MKRAVYLAAGVAAFALVAGQASGQDWQGPYVGIAGGAGTVDDSEDETVLFDNNLDGDFNDTVRNSAGTDVFASGPTPGGFCGGSPNSNNFNAGCEDDEYDGEGGLRAGYDFQSGPFVYGLVAEVGLSSASDSVTAFSTTPAQYSFRRDLEEYAALRARFGYAVGRFLPYVTAGGVYATIENRFATSNAVNSFTRVTNEDEHGGFQVGGGLETHVTENLRLGVEYLYTSIEDDSDLTTRVAALSVPPTAPNNPFLIRDARGTDFRRRDSDFDMHSFRLTATVSF